MRTLLNWESQWAAFAPNFYAGKAHIPLKNGKTLLLQPGPGFGDLSHSTTALVLNFMSDLKLTGQTVLDIGCGSGILSLAALLMGASSAIGIDIDASALTHARQNASLNQLEKFTHFSDSLPKSKKGIVLINMILSEQKSVLSQIPDLAEKASLWIASGFLTSQREEALAWTCGLGLSLLEERKEGEWLALALKRMR